MLDDYNLILPSVKEMNKLGRPTFRQFYLRSILLEYLHILYEIVMHPFFTVFLWVDLAVSLKLADFG